MVPCTDLPQQLFSAMFRGSYYRRLSSQPLQRSFTYFVCFSVFYALLLNLLIALTVIRPWSPVLTTLPARLSDLYPPELEIIISQGQVTTNVTEPYLVPVSRLRHILSNMRQDVLGTSSDRLQHLLVIDTQAQPAGIYTYQTFALLTSDSLIYRAQTSATGPDSLRLVPLDHIDWLVINRHTVAAIILHLTPMAQQLPAKIFLVSLTFFLLLLPLIRLLHIIILTFPIWLLGRIIGPSPSIKSSFQLTLHLYPAVLTYQLLGLLLGGLLLAPGTATLLTLVGAFLIFLYFKKHADPSFDRFYRSLSQTHLTIVPDEQGH